jgi:hypothetical protein
MVVAVALFALRKRRRLTYGCIEIGFGIVGLAVYPVAPSTDTGALSPATAAWLLGGMSLIYIIIRGLDNVDVAWAARVVKKNE